MVDRRGLNYPHRGWYNAIYMLMEPHVHAFRCHPPPPPPPRREWGWVCLILDTDTESYVTSPSVSVIMSLQFQSWMIQKIKPVLVAVEILFISSRCLQFWPNNSAAPPYRMSRIPGDLRVRVVTTCVRKVLCRLVTKTQ